MRTAFLSSTYRDLRPHRDAVYRAVEGLEGYHCVRMEDFGARDSTSAAFCAEQVARCDVFVGILGHMYGSRPRDSDLSFTELEYDAAIMYGKPRLMFLAAEDSASAEDTGEPAEARERQKEFRRRVLADSVSGTFHGPGELAAQVVAALYNLDFRREPLLARLEVESRQRRIRRWRAAGLPDELAVAFADDARVGAPDSWASQHLHQPLLILVGGVGSGKSLASERLLQAAIAAARLRPESPFPVYLTEAKLKAAVGRLADEVRVSVPGPGSPGPRGVALFLDGVDEVGWDSAAALLDEARALLLTWPGSRAVVASRPFPRLGSGQEMVLVPRLPDDDAWSLVSLVSGERDARYSARHLPESVRDAVHLPLFAILLGVLLGERRSGLPRSVGQMVSELADLALRRTRTEVAAAAALLQKLAVEVTRRAGPVPVSDIGTPVEVRPLVESRLVVDDQGLLSFALPVFAEWFAAQGLSNGDPPPHGVVSSPGVAERWRYPLVIMTATASHDSVSAYLRPLAADDPVLASEVIRDGIADRAMRTSSAPPPSPAEAESRIHEAMAAWTEGIGPLASLIAPAREDGTLLTCEAHVQGSWLTVGWVRDGAADAAAGQERNRDPWRDGRYVAVAGATPVAQSAWAWRWSQDELIRGLTRVLENRRLPTVPGPLQDEYIWHMVLKLTDRGSGYHSPISLDEIVSKAEAFDRRMRSSVPSGVPVHVTFGGHRPIRWDPLLLRETVERLRGQGLSALHPPWPGADLDPATHPGQWVWSFYGAAAFGARVSAVYGAALIGYEQLVGAWFPKFAPRLPLYSLMPINMVGALDPHGSRDRWEDQPSMLRYVEALPLGSVSTFTLLPREAVPPFESLSRRLVENRRSLRPSQPLRLIGCSVGDPQVLGAFPITELVYRWLWEDLEQVSWLNRGFARRYL